MILWGRPKGYTGLRPHLLYTRHAHRRRAGLDGRGGCGQGSVKAGWASAQAARGTGTGWRGGEGHGGGGETAAMTAAAVVGSVVCGGGGCERRMRRRQRSESCTRPSLPNCVPARSRACAGHNPRRRVRGWEWVRGCWGWGQEEGRGWMRACCSATRRRCSSCLSATAGAAWHGARGVGVGAQPKGQGATRGWGRDERKQARPHAQRWGGRSAARGRPSDMRLGLLRKCVKALGGQISTGSLRGGGGRGWRAAARRRGGLGRRGGGWCSMGQRLAG